MPVNSLPTRNSLYESTEKNVIRFFILLFCCETADMFLKSRIFFLVSTWSILSVLPLTVAVIGSAGSDMLQRLRLRAFTEIFLGRLLLESFNRLLTGSP